MSDDANVSMGFNENLLPEEKEVLKKYDADIWRVLSEDNPPRRYFWIGKEEANGRIVCLIVDPSPEPILKVSSKELINITSDDLLSRIKDCTR